MSPQILAERKAAYRSAEAAGIVSQQEVPQPVAQWLGRLALFYGVPFDNLVADSGMLPPESLNFFYVDANWTAALTDGALSIGGAGSQEQTFQEMAYPAIRAAAAQAAGAERKRLRKEALPENPAPAAAVSGMLLRSALVSGWPGLEVKPWADTGGQTPVNILRMERLAPDVLLCLFDAVPLRVDLCEPGEGVQFGVEDNPVQSGQPVVYLRGLGAGGYNSGQQIGTQDYTPWVLRDPSTNVLNVAAMQSALQSALQNLSPPALSNALSPGGFAVEMIKAPEIMTYENNGAAMTRASRKENVADGQ